MRTRQRGLTLLETATAISLTAIVVIVAIPVLRRELRGSHQAEAREALLRIGEGAAAYARVPKHKRTFPEAITRTPAEVPSGVAVVVPAEAWEPWRVLGVEVMPSGAPQRYAYTFARPAGESPSFEAIAEGDLDGDGVLARATLRGTVSYDGNVQITPDVEFVDALE
jgi:hypothetical protein